jgi:hypothetical protein
VVVTGTPKNYERRYTGRRPKVAHLLHESNIASHSANQWYTVACGLSGDMWQGTGSQDEYETADALPICRNCTKAVDNEGVWLTWELRELATGMPYRSQARREELLAWLRENRPKVFDMIPTRKRKDEE